MDKKQITILVKSEFAKKLKLAALHDNLSIKKYLTKLIVSDIRKKKIEIAEVDYE